MKSLVVISSLDELNENKTCFITINVPILTTKTGSNIVNNTTKIIPGFERDIIIETYDYYSMRDGDKLRPAYASFDYCYNSHLGITEKILTPRLVKELLKSFSIIYSRTIVVKEFLLDKENIKTPQRTNKAFQEFHSYFVELGFNGIYGTCSKREMLSLLYRSNDFL